MFLINIIIYFYFEFISERKEALQYLGPVYLNLAPPENSENRIRVISSLAPGLAQCTHGNCSISQYWVSERKLGVPPVCSCSFENGMTSPHSATPSPGTHLIRRGLGPLWLTTPESKNWQWTFGQRLVYLNSRSSLACC